MHIPAVLQGKRPFDLITGGIAGAILITAVGFNWTGYGFGWIIYDAGATHPTPVRKRLLGKCFDNFAVVDQFDDRRDILFVITCSIPQSAHAHDFELM